MMSLLHLYFIFLKIGVLTFGGGYAMIPLFQDELVTQRALLTTTEFADVVALAQMTPGPVGLNCATYIGQVYGGLSGAIVASMGVLTPSLVIGIAVAACLKRFQKNPVVAKLLNGIRPASLGMIASAVVFFAATSLVTFVPDNLDPDSMPRIVPCWPGIAIFAAVFFVQRRYKLPLPVVLGAAALAGALTMR